MSVEQCENEKFVQFLLLRASGLLGQNPKLFTKITKASWTSGNIILMKLLLLQLWKRLCRQLKEVLTEPNRSSNNVVWDEWGEMEWCIGVFAINFLDAFRVPTTSNSCGATSSPSYFSDPPDVLPIPRAVRCQPPGRYLFLHFSHP